jgi:hypothetical protein
MGGRGIVASASLVAAFIAAALWSEPARAALLTYDYTARLADEIGPYDASLWGSTASGSFTIDTGAASTGGGTYPLAMPSFTLATPTGIAVAAQMSLQLIDAAPGGGQDALAGHSTALNTSIPLAGTSPRSLGFYWADDSGTALSSTSLAALPTITLGGFSNGSLAGDYILFGFNDLLRSGAQGEYSLVSLALRSSANQAVAAPEPASLLLLLSGLAAMAWMRRVRQR